MECVIVRRRIDQRDRIDDLIGPFDDVDQAKQFCAYLRGGDCDGVYTVVPLTPPMQVAPTPPPPIP